ncbi:VOC family protein [Croceibacterium sp. LX-88]|jgi:catechol 2,3-dioxygenase-like lactoylglutathione lyase family enzyme|uniref:VOC family protein n=1 Tax=Croceibacterium selenioxidans TaxID=2838833 RepID=A0ABS5WAM8_9SPHN|nr:VOC family protein [Croceibacterium selenioxidans]MBT2135489.1 VOC family protein [Croceibacterium selenioxidans]
MIGYVTVGTNDLARSAAFYGEIARILGHGQLFTTERTVAWGTPEKGAMMSVITPYDGEPATVGNGSMFGFPAEREEQVHQIYDFALANGGKDEGPPGPRGEQFYGAYFRDPDGNKLVAYVFRG